MTPQRPFPLPPVRQQGRDYGITPVFQSGPMQPRKDVESFDLTRNLSPGRSLVTGDRSLTRNPNGRGGAPQLSPMGEVIGKRGMTPERLTEIARRKLSSAMRAGDMRATEFLYRGGMGGFGPRGFGPRGFGPRGFGPPPVPRAAMPPPERPVPFSARERMAPVMEAELLPLDPLANLEPPATTAQALGWPLEEPPQRPAGQPTSSPMMPSRMPWEGQPLPGGVPMGQLPPSTMMGGNGLPPPPKYSEQQVGGFNVLTGPDGKGGSKFLNAFTAPERGGPPPLSAAEMGRIRSAGMQPTQVGGRMFDAQGVPYLEAPVPTERVTEKSPDGATTRTYTQPRGTQANPPAGEGGGNYFDSLLPAAPTASTQTGQMPNVAYAAPLRQEPPQAGMMSIDEMYATYHPEMMLESARQEYATTGDDSAIREHLRRFPSEAVRLNQQEQQIWKEIGQGLDASLATQEQIQTAEKQREDYIKKHNYFGPMGQGAHALEWERTNPQQAALLNAPMPMLDPWKFLQAKTLSDNSAYETAKTMKGIRHMMGKP